MWQQLGPSWLRDSNTFTLNSAGDIIFLKLFGVFIKIYSRCEDKPTDLPKKATLPSVQTDTMSIAEEDFNTAARLLYLIIFKITHVSTFRGSITSYTKVSRNSSLRFDTQTSIGSPPVSPTVSSPGSGKTASVFRSLMNNLKRSETEDQGSGGNLERVTSKHSRRSDHLDS